MTKKKSSLWGKIFLGILFGIVLFSTGYIASEFIHTANASVTNVEASEDVQLPEINVPEVNEDIFDVLDKYSTKERISPGDHISEDEIHVYKDHIYIDINDASWGTFLDTNSMDPVLDYGHNSIEIKPESFKDIRIGDIIVYEHEEHGFIIHRVVATGFDNEGWYCTAKGDNNYVEDPWKIRFNQIEGIVVGIFY
jgi:hypothetical protein